ncbi:MAG: pyridoxal phosphate-dependent aminotransferase [Planctomycetes bacterium]|nr:pyridoxal phosphate-dependent aminotransferase [Planctomycetota bacterium]
MTKLAERMNRLGTETAFEVLARAKALAAQGRHIIHLEIGEPDFDTPANVIDAGIRALRSGQTHYGPAPGLPQLREAVARYVARTRRTQVSAEQVLVTPGGKPVMFYLMLALLQQGDEAVYPNPGFPIYESMIRYTGARPVPARLHPENDFRLDFREVRKIVNDKTRLLITNSPGNPCGNAMTRADTEAVVELLHEHKNLHVLSDEIYSRLLYEGEHSSPLSYPEVSDRVIVLDGFSKTYAMTGWRLGYGVMHRDLVKACAQLQVNCASCTASFTQLAGVEALEGPQDAVEHMCAEFRRRRDYLIAELNRIPGFRCVRPHGAFYAFPEIRGTGLSSAEVQNRLLNEAGVATLSGTAFGEHGEGFLRLSYANSMDNLKLAVERIRAAFPGQG